MWARDGGWRLVLLILAVLFGLLGMHGGLAPAATPHTAPRSETAAVSHEPGPAAPAVSAGAADLGAVGAPSDHDGVAHLLHLCVAVLAAVGFALLSAWLFLGRTAVPISVTPTRRRVGAMPVERPPPMRRRLAVLCVMRN